LSKLKVLQGELIHAITGGAGFIGSHLSEVLLEQGQSVVVIDSMSNGQAEWLQGSRSQPRFRFCDADVRDTAAVCEMIRGANIVWHLAANTNMVVGAESTRVDLENGIIATHSVLEAMKTVGVHNLLFASSGAVYGDIERPPASEEYGPLLPVSLYGACKLAAEGLISAYCSLFDINAWMFRFGNVLGSRMSHGVIYDFIHKLKNDPTQLEILGDGTAEKNYILVEEVIDGMLFAFDNRPQAFCEVFNLGSPSTTLVTDIADIVIEEMGLQDVKRHFTGGARGWPGDQPRVYMNVDKMHSLGWSTRYTSNQAVRIATRRYLGTATRYRIGQIS
jgi:UDP-glucose 4-epimerase